MLEPTPRGDRRALLHLRHVLVEEHLRDELLGEPTPAFEYRLLMWSWTVWGESTSAAAISLFVAPRMVDRALRREDLLVPEDRRTEMSTDTTDAPAPIALAPGAGEAL